MLDDLTSVSLLIFAGFYLVYNFFLLGVKLSMQRFRGASQTPGFLLSLLGFGGMCFGYGCLIYYGYNISWIAALTLLVAGYLVTMFIFATLLGVITAKKPDSIFIFGYSGFITVPISGYFMLTSIPA